MRGGNLLRGRMDRFKDGEKRELKGRTPIWGGGSVLWVLKGIFWRQGKEWAGVCS